MQATKTSGPALAILVMHLTCSSGILGTWWMADFQPSACAVTSSLLQILSLGLRAVQLLSGGPAVSKRSITLELMSIGCRLSSTMMKNGYLPIDVTGDFLYQFVDIGSITVALLLHRWASDRQRQCHAYADGRVSVMPVVMLALLFASLCHGYENASPIFDTLWLAGVFLGFYASIPQRLLVEYVGAQAPVLVQYSLLVTYISWMVSGYMMVSHFVYYVGTAEFSRFTCAILLVYSLAACLFIDFVGASSIGLSLVRSRHLADLDEFLQSKRLPLFGGLRVGCMILSPMLLVCALSAHRALAGKGGERFVSAQLMLSLVFLNIVFFTTSSRKQLRVVRNSFWHAFPKVYVSSKLPKMQLNRSNCVTSEKRQAPEPINCRKKFKELSAVNTGAMSDQAACTHAVFRRAKPEVKCVSLRASSCVLVLVTRAYLFCKNWKACIACRLEKLSVTIGRTCVVAWRGNESRLQDCWVRGIILGIGLVLASIVFSDRHMLIFYGAGFLYTAVFKSASAGVRWCTAPRKLPKGASVSIAAMDCNIEPDGTFVRKYLADASLHPGEGLSDSISCILEIEDTAGSSLGLKSTLSTTTVQKTPEYHMTTNASRICLGFDNGMGLSCDAEQVVGCEPAGEKAVDASLSKQSLRKLEIFDDDFTVQLPLVCDAENGLVSRQSWRDLKMSDDESVKEGRLASEPAVGQAADAREPWLGCELTVGQAIDATASEQSRCDLGSFEDQFTKETSLVSEQAVAQAFNASASKQSWGDLESSDDDFCAMVRIRKQREAHSACYAEKLAYTTNGDVSSKRQRSVSKSGAASRWYGPSCSRKLAPMTKITRWLGEYEASKQPTKNIPPAMADAGSKTCNRTYYKNW